VFCGLPDLNVVAVDVPFEGKETSSLPRQRFPISVDILRDSLSACALLFLQRVGFHR